ncbi:hypothetical protein VCUG_00139 [Vavraia culicis subsp. floridensis]|uniref:Ubiquitin-related modifier 1 n=1 Tax=Vavraia culicis (isolate floridensis) TaxID=948595 RepID=L2GYE0_VAVCU|nr:uncharacterized protein VCUG_00139 [Vavraia culicis subsp. floridensis]ELA48303.1 hypothetical protein VCUG_00139 [Vavraia culicis subsp. floridensis]
MKIIFQGVDPSKLQSHTLTIAPNTQVNNIPTLIGYLNAYHDTQAFFKDNVLPPGMMCIINGVDSCCGDGCVSAGDEIVFINSLHGG